MKKRKPNSAFDELYLEPLQRDLLQAEKEHGVGTPEYKTAEARARLVHGLRMENHLLKNPGEGHGVV